MLKRLKINSLTLFQNEVLEFSPGINVIVGENGSGKTHLLKVAYSILAVSAEAKKNKDVSLSKVNLQKRMAEKLIGVFRPDTIGRLASRKQGKARCEITAEFKDAKSDISLSFATNSVNSVSLDKLPSACVAKEPVYIHTRELLSLYPGFVSMYQNQYVDFEETWYDTSLLLGRPGVRGPKEEKVKGLLEPLEEAMGGRIIPDTNGRFYFKPRAGSKIEIPLVAEGIRKLAMIARLIATGSLLEKGYLFWDEPEANLNPKLIKKVAEILSSLSRNGIQIFIATHSLFLLRELEIISSKGKLDFKYFALSDPTENGVRVSQAKSLIDIEPLSLLDENLMQTDRYLGID